VQACYEHPKRDLSRPPPPTLLTALPPLVPREAPLQMASLLALLISSSEVKLCGEVKLCHEVKLCSEVKLCGEVKLCQEVKLCGEVKLCRKVKLCDPDPDPDPDLRILRFYDTGKQK
ncbi:hypothetical protein Tco_0831575, partial [Tanacetum coccineum]